MPFLDDLLSSLINLASELIILSTKSTDRSKVCFSPLRVVDRRGSYARTLSRCSDIHNSLINIKQDSKDNDTQNIVMIAVKFQVGKLSFFDHLLFRVHRQLSIYTLRPQPN